MSLMKFDTQYAARLTPETIYMCFTCVSRSLIMNEMIIVGIMASAICRIKLNVTAVFPLSSSK